MEAVYSIESSRGTTDCSSPDSEAPTSVSSTESKAVPSNCDPRAQELQHECLHAHSSGSESAAADADMNAVDMEIDPDPVGKGVSLESSFNNVGANSNDSDSIGKSVDQGHTEGKSLEEMRAEKYAEAVVVGTRPGSEGSSHPSSESNPAAGAEESIKLGAEDKEDADSTPSSGPSSSDSSTYSNIDSSPAGQESIGSEIIAKSSNTLDNPLREPTESNKTRTKTENQSLAEDPIEEDFNDFTFWRTPLPDVNVDLDLVKVKVEVQRDQDSGIEVDPLGSQLEGIHMGEPNRDGSQEETTIHTASLNTVSDAPETVTNIGSTHVLGQHLNETTMTVVNGVVQGRGKHHSEQVSACALPPLTLS